MTYYVYSAVRESDYTCGSMWIENVSCCVIKNAGIFDHQISVCENHSIWAKSNLSVSEDVTIFDFVAPVVHNWMQVHPVAMLSVNEEYNIEEMTEFGDQN